MTTAAPIALGQRFDSLQDFKNVLRNWAVEACFTPAILDSDSRRVRVGCRSVKDCPFRIRCNFHVDGNYASVTVFDGAHTCASASGRLVSQNIKRAEVTRLKFLLSAVPQLMKVTPETTTKSIIDVIQEQYGQKIALRQAQKVKAILSPKSTEPCHRCGSTHQGSRRCGMRDNGHAKPTEPPTVVQPDNPPTQIHQVVTQALEPDSGDDLNMADSGFPSSPTPEGESESDVQSSTPINNTVSIALSSHVVNRHAQEVRNEAARLMQRASELIQEAARLNAEAARLTASVANE